MISGHRSSVISPIVMFFTTIELIDSLERLKSKKYHFFGKTSIMSRLSQAKKVRKKSKITKVPIKTFNITYDLTPVKILASNSV